MLTASNDFWTQWLWDKNDPINPVDAKQRFPNWGRAQAPDIHKFDRPTVSLAAYSVSQRWNGEPT